MNKTFVAWYAEAIAREMQHQVQADDPEALRRLQQKLDHADLVWRSWAMANDGSVLTAGQGEGVVEIPPSKLKDLPALQKQYGEALQSTVTIGVGTKLSEAERALRAAKLRGGDTVFLYTPQVDEMLEEASKPKDPISNIVGEPMTKALAQNPHTGGGGFGGFSRGGAPVAPTAPMQEASEHSQAEGLRNTIAAEASGAPPAPEMTHAARDLESEFHDLASAQEQQDAQGQNEAAKSKAAIKAAVASVLQRLRGQAQVLGQLKAEAPDAYNAVTALVQSVIAMAHSLEEQQPGQGLSKAEMGVLLEAKRILDGRKLEKMALANIRVGNRDEKIPTREVYRYDHVLSPELRSQGYALHVLDHEDEGAPCSSAGLQQNGRGIGFVTLERSSETGFLKESTLKVPHQGKGLGQAMYEAVLAHAKNKHGVTRLEGSQHSTMASRVHQKLAEKHGLAYRPRYGVPHGEGGPYDDRAGPYGYALKGELPMEKGKLPMPETKKRHDVVLPVGSVKQGGPSGNAHGDVGKVKVEHGDGKTSWIEARAGQVTAVADRHAKPVLGHASHPLSSRNPTGR